jgi:AcrR family transcriptional regulator
VSTIKTDTRYRLFEAARKLLLKRGFHGVGLEDIAEAAGVSRQAVYKSHFASKADLLLELVRHVHDVEKLDELTRPVIEAKTGLEMLEATIRASVRIEERVHELSLVLAAAAVSDAGAAAAWRDRMELKRGALRSAVSRLQRENRLGRGWQVEQAVDVLDSLLSVDTYQRLVTERGWKQEELVQRVQQLCAGSFLVEPQKRSQSRAPIRGRSVNKKISSK